MTDRATFAWLCDVDVPPANRGRRLGLALAQAVVDELRPLDLKRVLLTTPDAQGLYRRVGFASVLNPEKLMQLVREAQ